MRPHHQACQPGHVEDAGGGAEFSLCNISMLSPLQVMYTVFQRDGFDYFSDMMPALHNYVTVDTKAFLSTPDFMMCMYNMAKTMLEGDPGEDPECHAAKLLEVD